MTTRPYKTHDGRVLVATTVYSKAREADVILVEAPADRPDPASVIAVAVHAKDKYYADALTSWERWATPAAAKWAVQDYGFYPVYFELRPLPKIEVPVAPPPAPSAPREVVDREIYDDARNAVVDAGRAFKAASLDIFVALGGSTVTGQSTTWVNIPKLRQVSAALQEYAGLMEGIAAGLDAQVGAPVVAQRESPRAALAGLSNVLAGAASAMAMERVFRKALGVTTPEFEIGPPEGLRVASWLLGAVAGPVGADIREALRTGRAFNAQEIRAISKAVA